LNKATGKATGDGWRQSQLKDGRNVGNINEVKVTTYINGWCGRRQLNEM